MKLVVSILLAPALVFAWQSPLPPVSPDKTVAHVNGEPVTAGKLSAMLAGAPPLAVNSAASDPGEFLTWTYLLSKMSALAQSQGLDKKSPYADRLAWNRAQVLMMARIEEKNREAAPDSKEVETLYQDNPQRYGVAKTKLIFIPAGPGAKAKMDGVVAQAKKGVDFVKLVKLYSADQDSAARDGDFDDINAESKIPEEIRKTIFTTKVGSLTPVISQPAGLYLFQVNDITVTPFEQVAKDTADVTRVRKASEWMAGEKEKASVKILHEEFFKMLRVTAGPMVSRGAEEINLQATPQTADIQPTTPLAEINGKTMTAADYTNMIKSLAPQIRTKAVVAPTDFLRDYAFMLRLRDDAETLGLDKKQPYLNRLKYDRDTILMQAAVDEHLNEIVVTVEEQKAGYAADPNKFRTALVRVLYLSYSLTPPPQSDPNAPKVLTEAEAREKIEGILKEYRENQDDFAKYVLRYSEDERSKQEGGLMPPISFTDPQVPPNVKEAIFAAKAGDVVGPVKMPNGFFVFKVDSLDTRKYEEVKDQIYEELRQERFQNWFNEQRASFKVTIDDPEGFKAAVAQTVR